MANRDPIGEKGGLNLYGFVRNSPIEFYDAFGTDSWPPVIPPSVPYLPPYVAPRVPQYPQGFSLCQRDLQKDSSCDCPTMVGNALGGEHSYLQHVDSEGNRWGWGFGRGGTVEELHFDPNSCKPCRRSGTLPGGKSAANASVEEIEDCIKNTKPSDSYGTFRYNCRDWAKEAAKKCGLDCN